MVCIVPDTDLARATEHLRDDLQRAVIWFDDELVAVGTAKPEAVGVEADSIRIVLGDGDSLRIFGLDVCRMSAPGSYKHSVVCTAVMEGTVLAS